MTSRADGRRRRIVLSAVLSVAAALGSPARAEPVVLFCEVQSQASRGWISPQMALVIDAGAGSAIVNDLVTMGATGGPVAARIASRNDRQIVVTWEVRSKDTVQQSVRASYRATIRTADYGITVSMRPLGFGNSFRARGSCRAGRPAGVDLPSRGAHLPG